MSEPTEAVEDTEETDETEQKRRRTWDDRFTDAADWVSSAMGTPLNIGIWLLAVALWFLVFIVNPALANSNFLPAWFTSQAFNFPLNSITTLAELYIGFLVAAASNRLERRNRAQMDRLDAMERQMVRMEQEHGRILRELHAHVTCEGHTTIGEAGHSKRDPKTGRYRSRRASQASPATQASSEK